MAYVTLHYGSQQLQLSSFDHRYNNTVIGNFRMMSQISMGSTSIGIGAARSLNFRGSFRLNYVGEWRTL